MRKMNTYGILLIIALIFVSCGASTWSEEDQDTFLNECGQEGGGSSYCKCYLDKVMAKYPNAADAERMDFETAVEMAKTCE